MIDYGKYLGIPYKKSYEPSFDGCDCYGMVKLIYKTEFDIDLPTYVIDLNDQKLISEKIEECKPLYVKLNQPMPNCILGLVLINKYTDHTGIFMESDKFLHTNSKNGIHVNRINNPWWKRHISGYYYPKEYIEKFNIKLN